MDLNSTRHLLCLQLFCISIYKFRLIDRIKNPYFYIFSTYSIFPIDISLLWYSIYGFTYILLDVYKVYLQIPLPLKLYTIVLYAVTYSIEYPIPSLPIPEFFLPP